MNRFLNRTCLVIIILAGLLIQSCVTKNEAVKIVITRVPAGKELPDPTSGDRWRFAEGSSLALVDPDHASTPDVLTSDFYSACSPYVSWDGKILLFAGQQKEGETWQIWKMDLSKRKFSKITNWDTDCIDPVSLPSGKIMYSKFREGSNPAIHDLYTCNSDGSDPLQITFNPHSNLATAVLKDGRLITVTRQLIPEQKDPMLAVLRPDGSKFDLFGYGKHGYLFTGRVHESEDGRIFYILKDTIRNKGILMSVNYNRPLFTQRSYADELSGSFGTVCPLQPGKLLVTYREEAQGNYGLYVFDTETNQTGKKVYASPETNIIDAVLIKEIVRPKKLPSEVDMGVKTGLLMCQDLNFTDLGLNTAGASSSPRIEIAGIDSSMGMINVEPDGSFFLKIIADKPFRINKLDEKSQIVATSGWIWLRPNERRGCIGCHENPELAPFNRVSMAVKKDPVNVPVHIANISEKDVELE